MLQGQLHHIEYYVTNITETQNFWSWFLEALDYTLDCEFDGGFTYTHKSGTYLVFVEVEENLKQVRNDRQAAGLNHIAFYVDSNEKLRSLEEKVRGAGAEISKSNEKHFCFEDGNRFAVEVFV